MPVKRLVLFDIDGTLIWGGPLWKESFVRAFEMHFPNLEFPNFTFDGKTDHQICRELLAHHGLNPQEIENEMNEVILEYVRHAETQISVRRHEITVLPGVREILNALSAHNDVTLALLTGNVEKGAHLKLSAVDLHKHFQFGVYGDDHWNRYELPKIAVRRVKEKLGIEFAGKEIVIIGDTVHDVNCGKSIGVRSIAVGTGRRSNSDEILKQNPDYFFKDLSNTQDVLTAVLEHL